MRNLFFQFSGHKVTRNKLQVSRNKKQGILRTWIVTLEATTPPQIENYIGLFVDQYDENNYNSTPKLTKVKTIYVPVSSLSAYQNAEGWKDLATNGINLLPKP
ncbi:hypothetical protein CAPN006_14260 [Capnocytophaga canimorsus]|uniref:hypothetical protein n=1 Tax=Capnocytophaga canimorsus TaxID=28188 RepID=UPI001AD5DF47|nr:hypothetical protein [Capnocytophaga canimorsus]GIM57033.1 hypothetical protein CAPN006_14260 [Capnocytophaga canimorsus]